MISYKKLIDIHEAFANAHYEIKNFGNGERWQVTDHDQDSFFKYPLMWIEDRPQRSLNKEWVYSFRIWFVTRVESPENRTEDLLYQEYKVAKSLMVQCAQDLISFWAKDTTYPFISLDRSISIETFTDREPDRLTGCYVDINFSVAFDYNKCIIPMGNMPTPENPCQPVLIYENGILVATVDSGGTYSYVSGGGSVNVTVNSKNTDDEIVATGNYTANGTYDQSIPDNTNDFNFNTLAPTPSGQNKSFQVLNLDSDYIGNIESDSTNTTVVRIPSAGIEINGSPIASIVPDQSKLITIRYADDSPVVVTTILDTPTVFIGEVPDVVVPIHSSLPYKSGAITSIYGEDDGETKIGRGTDWYTLDYNNFFGTTKRFTGITGGYQDAALNYFDVNDNATTQALAFPDSIKIDWAYWNQTTGSVMWWYDTPFSSNGTNALANQPYTLAGFNDWRLPNIMQLRTLLNYELYGVSTMMNYPPFNYPSFATSNRFWTCQPIVAGGNLANFSGGETFTNNSLATTCRVFPYRLGNTSEL